MCSWQWKHAARTTSVSMCKSRCRKPFLSNCKTASVTMHSRCRLACGLCITGCQRCLHVRSADHWLVLPLTPKIAGVPATTGLLKCSHAKHSVISTHARECSEIRPLVACWHLESVLHPTHSHCAHLAPPHLAVLLQLWGLKHLSSHSIPHRCLALIVHVLPFQPCLNAPDRVQYAVHQQASASIA